MSQLDFDKVYITDDFASPKQSTIEFHKFLEHHKAYQLAPLSDPILDIGAGGASGLHYLAARSVSNTFVGVEYNTELVEWVNQSLLSPASNFYLHNLSLIHGDWNRPDNTLRSIMPKKVGGLISVHALCTQRIFSEAAANLTQLNPEWIAFNSLFYNGPMDVLIHIRDHLTGIEDFNPDGDFNIHSLPMAITSMNDLGYSFVDSTEFNIGIDLPIPDGNARGTYTIKTAWSERSQFSGPVYLPWHFLLFKRI